MMKRSLLALVLGIAGLLASWNLPWLLSSGQGALAAENSPLTTPLPDTGQTEFYDNSKVISPPKEGQPFYGQDASYTSREMQYRDNGDGTITDLVTGLMWQQDPGQKKSWQQGIKEAKTCRTGGYDDWRMPTIKELYSLINFTGYTGNSASSSIPYLDTNYFNFTYGDTAAGERFIDCQYWSATKYVSTTMNKEATVFGVNFADGRIKGYPVNKKAATGTSLNTLYALYVRGNPEYGKNMLIDNGDGTISDLATGLMWLKGDSGTLQAGKSRDGRLNWQEALQWAENLSYAGYSDWRLPDAKELQSIVDYSRSPDTTNSAAISPLFIATSIVDNNGAKNYPYYWTGTTHLDGPNRYSSAVYLAFGEAQGYMSFGEKPGINSGFSPPSLPGKNAPPASSVQGSGTGATLMDVHGAGAQRSDPKTGDASKFPQGRGPQGDVIVIDNFARPVRTID